MSHRLRLAPSRPPTDWRRECLIHSGGGGSGSISAGIHSNPRRLIPSTTSTSPTNKHGLGSLSCYDGSPPSHPLPATINATATTTPDDYDEQDGPQAASYFITTTLVSITYHTKMMTMDGFLSRSQIALPPLFVFAPRIRLLLLLRLE